MPLVLRSNLTENRESDTRARLERWVCLACEHECTRKVVPNHCLQCGMLHGYAPQPIEVLGTRSDEIDEIGTGILVPEWADAFPRGLPLGRSMVLRGRPGAGKSRAGYRFASQIGTCMVFGIEMGTALSVETARKAGAQMSAFYWYQDTEGLSDLEVLDPAVVVVDSIQKLGRDRRRIVNQLMMWARDYDRNCVFISQLSADGKSRFGEDDDFDCDVIVDVSAGRTAKGGISRRVHGLDDKQTPCRDGCTHASIAKSRVCPLVSFDVPIVDGC